MPGRFTSAGNIALPVTFAGPSARPTGLPMVSYELVIEDLRYLDLDFRVTVAVGEMHLFQIY